MFLWHERYSFFQPGVNQGNTTVSNLVCYRIFLVREVIHSLLQEVVCRSSFCNRQDIVMGCIADAVECELRGLAT